MDCTLRDGSYAVDFQFTSKFTNELATKLDQLGFSYIEVGHGMGIDASEKARRAAATDIEYAKATQSAVRENKWGMFAIPGIASVDNVNRMFDLGMNFVRVGIDALELETGLDFVEKIMRSGREVFVNFMKSYALSYEELGERINLAANCGVDGIYLVDSAGGMLPNEIETLSKIMLENRGTSYAGFHGHDNLGLAVYNSYYLATQGFDIIDCTMQGLGRSSGNAETEQLAAILFKTGISNGLNISEILKTGEELVRPKIPQPGHSGLDTFAGLTLFHTSYMENLLQVCRKTGVDPYVLMQEHCTKNKITATNDQLFEVALRLLNEGFELNSPLPSDKYIGSEQ